MHANIRILFEKLAEQKKISHAYLFSGNDHAGKKEIIERFLAAGNIGFPDQMRIVPAEKEISIGQIRQLREFASMSAWTSSHKVGVIEQAHAMNREAQSAFLKLLEEPKGNLVLFLLTEYPEILLDTIRSRTQEFPLYNFEAAEVSEETRTEFEKLQKASLHDRFAYAKKLADSPEEITQTLIAWTALLRNTLIDTAKQDAKASHAIAQKIKTAQEVSYILQTSNANPRLALERLLLDL